MPNWCYTDVSIRGDAIGFEKLLSLLKKAEDITDTAWVRTQVGFEPMWLGSIALALGYSVCGKIYKDGIICEADSSSDEIFCRGRMDINYWTLDSTRDVPPGISDLLILQLKEFLKEECDDIEICFFIESAWVPPTDLLMAIEKECGLIVEYMAEEPGCEVYINTDNQTFSEIIYLHTSRDSYYLVSENQLLKLVKDEYGINASSYEELNEIIQGDEKYDEWYLAAFEDLDGIPWYIKERSKKK